MSTSSSSIFFKCVLWVIAIMLCATIALFIHTLYDFFSSSSAPPLSLITLKNLHSSSKFAATKPEISSIDSWMTFSYLERVFQLPPTYLSPALRFPDPRYPRLTIKKYATTHGLSVTSTLMDIKNLVASFSTSSATSSLWK